jgi:hypothetical protein
MTAAAIWVSLLTVFNAVTDRHASSQSPKELVGSRTIGRVNLTARRCFPRGALGACLFTVLPRPYRSAPANSQIMNFLARS